MSQQPMIKIEVRTFKSEGLRDRYYQQNGDDLFANPGAYGVYRIVYADNEFDLRLLVEPKETNITAFVKILGRAGKDEREALYTKNLETAVGWFYNP